MAAITIQLQDTERPQITVVGVYNAPRAFLSVRLGHDVTLYFPGFDAECAQHARTLAAQLMTAADALEARTTPSAPAAEVA